MTLKNSSVHGVSGARRINLQGKQMRNTATRAAQPNSISSNLNLKRKYLGSKWSHPRDKEVQELGSPTKASYLVSACVVAAEESASSNINFLFFACCLFLSSLFLAASSAASSTASSSAASDLGRVHDELVHVNLSEKASEEGCPVGLDLIAASSDDLLDLV
mmetsp:Transcript_8767/g.16086  ORF Transcript_8767/g.16086 Transcript_8767/m.16086 type:complete len:162 (-) Transcript_8767:163-648(-)